MALKIYEMRNKLHSLILECENKLKIDASSVVLVEGENSDELHCKLLEAHDQFITIAKKAVLQMKADWTHAYEAVEVMSKLEEWQTQFAKYSEFLNANGGKGGGGRRMKGKAFVEREKELGMQLEQLLALSKDFLNTDSITSVFADGGMSMSSKLKLAAERLVKEIERGAPELRATIEEIEQTCRKKMHCEEMCVKLIHWQVDLRLYIDENYKDNGVFKKEEEDPEETHYEEEAFTPASKTAHNKFWKLYQDSHRTSHYL